MDETEKPKPMGQVIQIDEARIRDHPYVFIDGIVMKRSSAGEVSNVSLLVATGVATDGYREILASWKGSGKTSPAGRASCAIWPTGASPVCSGSSQTRVDLADR